MVRCRYLNDVFTVAREFDVYPDGRGVVCPDGA